jgi:hypothetical protein
LLRFEEFSFIFPFAFGIGTFEVDYGKSVNKFRIDSVSKSSFFLRQSESIKHIPIEMA